MYSSSPKWLNMDSGKLSPNYVTVTNAAYQGNSNQYTPKSQAKN
jgi:hypothetical protein